MLKRLSSRISKFSTGWITLISAVIFILFTVLVLPRQSANSSTQVADTRSPDLSFYYSSAELYQMAESYGEDGRAAYINARFTFDLIWPLVYGFFLISALSWLLLRAFPSDSSWQQANLMPLLGMIFDYLENISTSLVMWRYPAQTPLVGWLAGLFTTLKWLLIGGSFVMLVAALLLAAWHWLARADD